MIEPITFGLVRETLPEERRVALTPTGVERLTSTGHSVLMETKAGDLAGFTDDDYRAVGAQICLSTKEIGDVADVVIKCHAPSKSEHHLLRKGGTLLGFLHLSNPKSADLRQTLRTQQSTAISLELLEDHDGSRPVLEAVSAIGGRVAILMAAQHMLAAGGGHGRLFGGAPGVPPLHVAIVGAGAAGEAAAREAHRLGALVTVLDQDASALRRIHRRIDGIATAMAGGVHLDRAVSNADLLLCAVASPGRPAPQIVSRRQVRTMPAGALIIDMSVDEGGCCETTRNHPGERTYIEEGIRHLCIPNLPSEVAHTASIAFTNAILPYLTAIAEMGVSAALASEPGIYRSAVYVDGKLRNPAVSELTGEPLGR